MVNCLTNEDNFKLIALQVAAAQQQYVPVSMVDQASRQMLVTGVQTSWAGGRQVAVIPSTWPGPHPPAPQLQQPLIPESAEWGRPLLVDSAAIIQMNNSYRVTLASCNKPIVNIIYSFIFKQTKF